MIEGISAAVTAETQDRIKAVEDEAKARDDADKALQKAVDDLSAEIGNLSNVMNFIGFRTVSVENEVIKVTAVDDETFESGDVVVDTTGKEYVYDGSVWREFGYADANTGAIAQNTEDIAKNAEAIAKLDEYVGKTDTSKGLTKRITDLETFKNTTVPATYETIAKVDLVRDDVLNLKNAVGDNTKGLVKQANDNSTAITNIIKDGGTIDTVIDEAIKALDVPDTAVTGKLVSAVSETDGKISVTRRELVKTDIPTLDREQVDGVKKLYDDVYNEETGLAKRALQADLTTLQERVGLTDSTGLSKSIADVKANYLKIGSTNRGTESNPIYDIVTQDGDIIIFDCGGIE